MSANFSVLCHDEFLFGSHYAIAIAFFNINIRSHQINNLWLLYSYMQGECTSQISKTSIHLTDATTIFDIFIRCASSKRKCMAFQLILGMWFQFKYIGTHNYMGVCASWHFIAFEILLFYTITWCNIWFIS